MKNKSKKSEALKILKDCLEASTSHGIPSILRNENLFLKIMWTLFFLLSSGYCIYGLINGFKSYFSFDVNTVLKFYRTSEIEFPTITICNKHNFNFKNTTPQAMLDNLKYLKKQALSFDSFMLNSTDTMTMIRDVYYFIDYGMNQFNISSEAVRNIGYSMKDMLLNCRFNDIKCSEDDFEYVSIMGFGNCYKFNSGKNSNLTEIGIKKISFSGRNNGLRLELFTGQRSIQNDISISDGVHIFISNSSKNFFSEREGFGLSVGALTDVRLSQIFNEKLPNPYGNCILEVTNPNSHESFLFTLTIKYQGIYEQRICLLLCFQKYIIDNYKCYEPTLPNYSKGSKYCEYGPRNKAFSDFYLYKSKECLNECPPECNYVEFNVQLSHTQFPSIFYSDLLIQHDKLLGNVRNFSSYEQLRSSTLAVNIYYDDIGYTTVVEVVAKTFEQFFGEVGGFLGLCIGISLLSVIEVLEIIFKIAFVYLRKENNPKLSIFPVKN
ncbi:unnamed protein product [Brachionus calyciflorus]|uniref:Uncharacterized protein n=1 Tax=Brachionus calyciflorus TaxID=104777 RepID=A0A814FSD5_9BILA|nr:unnamed protein product [Brachionus calyciflorus]